MPSDEAPARPKIVRTDRKMVYRNRWMTVWEDQVVFPDGSSGIYGCVYESDNAPPLVQFDAPI